MRAAVKIGVVLVVGAGAVLVFRHMRPAWPGGAAGGTRRIVVAPFQASSAPSGWSPAAFAESLAARLRADPRLDARAGTSLAWAADYRLDGTISLQGGRTVIALQLAAGGRAPIWTATFWRQDLGDTSLAGDLARAVAEAIPAAR